MKAKTVNGITGTAGKAFSNEFVENESDVARCLYQPMRVENEV